MDISLLNSMPKIIENYIAIHTYQDANERLKITNIILVKSFHTNVFDNCHLHRKAQAGMYF